MFSDTRILLIQLDESFVQPEEFCILHNNMRQPVLLNTTVPIRLKFLRCSFQAKVSKIYLRYFRELHPRNNAYHDGLSLSPCSRTRPRFSQ